MEFRKCEWQVLIKERSVGFPNFYWEAFNYNNMLKFENSFPFTSSKSAKENFRDFAKSLGISNYKVLA